MSRLASNHQLSARGWGGISIARGHYFATDTTSPSSNSGRICDWRWCGDHLVQRV